MYAAVLNSHTLPIKCGTGFDLEHSELNTSLYTQYLFSARFINSENFYYL